MSSRERNPRLLAFGKRLSQARTRLHFSQEALAEAIGTTGRSISRWECNQALPQNYYLKRLCEVLQITPEALLGGGEKEQEDTPQNFPLWHVPYTRNPYFTGREALLIHLHEKLCSDHQVTIAQTHLLSGLGGIGKTQTALEYAYRFCNAYQAVLWVGAETSETWMADYLALAYLFQLPEKDSHNHSLITAAVKRWFQSHSGWLLIFDNVEDLDLLHQMMPDIGQGHVLITTRSQITGTLGSSIDLQKLDGEEGILFLLRKAKLIRTDAPLETASPQRMDEAETLVDLLDGLPLALDQAAAYIEETACTLSDYLDRYRSYRKELLGTRGLFCHHHPASVTTTFSLAFQQVEQISPAARDLLQMMAFLHAEVIPEAFFLKQEAVSDPTLPLLAIDPHTFDGALKVLRRFSLIHREPETKTLSLHRLVQAVIRDQMSENTCKQQVEQLLRTFLTIFPGYDDAGIKHMGIRSHCQPYLPHALICASFIKEYQILSEEAGELLYRVAVYFQLLGDYHQAISLTLQAVTLAEQLFGRDHPTVAFYLSGLAHLYSVLGHFLEAEAYLRESLAIREKIYGPHHSEVADNLWVLARLLCRKRLYAAAQALAQRALEIKEELLGPSHYEIAHVLNAIGLTYLDQGEYMQAKSSFERAIMMYRETVGEHLYTITCLRNLGLLHVLQEHFPQATDLYQQTLQMCEKHWKLHHFEIAFTVHWLGKISFMQKNYQQSIHYYKRALALFEEFTLPRYFYAAYTLIDLGELYLSQNHRDLAEDCVERALLILGESPLNGPLDTQQMMRCLLLVGDRFAAQGNATTARTYYQRAWAIGVDLLGSEHPLTQRCWNCLAMKTAEDSET